jgi:aminoglycoside phosphotransferase (APT) family kinase protein
MSPTNGPGSGVEAATSSRDLVELRESLRRMALVSTHTDPIFRPLAGGVSSDIYRVDLPTETICVKRALTKLKVAADWRVPVERNRFEVLWLRVAGGIVPDAVPAILGEDPAGGAFAMAYLPPDRYPVWKDQLRNGTIDVAAATAVGDVLGRLHAATADDASLASQFATDAIFEAIRLEPYLTATASRHPQLAPQLTALAAATRANKRVLVHGDFSPKNILQGAGGPVILDAECAWFGDPAFDVAFVLNHLLLKGAWRPQWRARYVDLFRALGHAYSAHVNWEHAATLAARIAALLPGLMLARIDGKSPVEYLARAETKDEVRSFATALIVAPVESPEAIAQRWLGAAPQ